MRQISIRDDILELTSNGPQLLGGRCRQCNHHVFPFIAGCARCTSEDMERVALAKVGTLWAWTIQGFPPKAPPYLGETKPENFQPYGVGYVELDGQLKVETRLTEADPARIKNGLPMKLTTVVLCKNEDGDEVVTFAFAPISSGV